MIQIRISMEIDASPEVVFDLLADHTKHPLWDPSMLEASLFADGPIVQGSRGLAVGTFRGGRMETEIYYNAYDRPTYVSGGTSSGPVSGKQSCEFLPTDTGTRINWNMDLNFKGFMCLLQPLLKSSLKKQRQATLAALKTYIEAGCTDNQR